MMIILEGPDGAGKSTLAKELGQRLSARVGHMSKTSFQQDLALLDESSRGGLTIWDRSYLSEQVYGPVMRGKDSLGAPCRRMLDRVALANLAVVILCMPPLPTVLKNWGRKLRGGSEDFITEEDQLRQIYAGYQELRTEIPVLVYDYQVHSIRSLMDWAMAELFRGLRASNRGDILLVGDQVSHQGQRGYPFVWDTGCAPWLAEQLERAKIPETRLRWTNCRTPEGKQATGEGLREENFSRIIALGAPADLWCTRMFRRHMAFTHPQHWKRFRSKEPYPLIDCLRALTLGGT